MSDHFPHRSSQSELRSPIIVLVRPQMGENIGAAARAMLNFGMTGMRLVAPRDGWPNERAAATGAGASAVLDHVQVFASVADAIADCTYVLATTVRQRGLFLPVLNPNRASENLYTHALAGKRTAILFGAENAGLETDEVAHADAILTVPVNPAFSSLNLAQAVLVIAYEWSKRREMRAVPISPYEEELADRGVVDAMVVHMIDALDASGYFYPLDKRPTLERNVRTLLSNAKMTTSEVQLFRGLIKQLARGPKA